MLQDDARVFGELPAEGQVDTSASQALGVDAIFRTYASYVATIAFRLLGRDDEVDDVTQEVFLRVARGIPKLREPVALRAWLGTITVRVVRTKLRTRKFRRFFGMFPLSEAWDAPHFGGTPEEHALISELYKVVADLPVEQRLAWSLRYLEGENLEGVANLCGCSLATAKRRIAEAQQTIKRVTGHE